VEQEHLIVDARLERAQRLRGRLRREVHGHEKPGEVARYVTAFDKLVAAESQSFWTLDAGTLRKMHNVAVGGSEFRMVQLTVGRHHSFPVPPDILTMVEAAIDKAVRSKEPLAVAAARIHLDLLTIHPFLDGNGRTARLASTLLLLRGGFRSTLLTAVEQHFHQTPGKYVEILDKYRYGEITEDECVCYLIHAMIANAMYAAWFRKRELRLRAVCAGLGIESTAATHALIAYDSSPALSGDAAALAEAVADKESPLYNVTRTATAEVQAGLAFQVGVLLDEERTCAQEDNCK
jgi:prophage maintenance system killer protein